jgi:hypothetical protein
MFANVLFANRGDDRAPRMDAGARLCENVVSGEPESGSPR